ncbi:MAG TPA: zinc-dependent metalloprotease [Flavipsychrobacter sp.]
MRTLTQSLRSFIIVAICTMFAVSSQAQYGAKCGFDKTVRSLVNAYPALADTLHTFTQESRAVYKTTFAGTPVVPVVFHVVLTQSQLNQLGGIAGVERRIDSQLVVLNRDFNAMNADSVGIPQDFKPLFGNAGIRFALAHTAPDGSATPGYEITITGKNGFNVENEWGSGFGFSGAKYATNGGVDAWDPDSYLNIWVINPLEGGAATNILGLAVPTWLASDDYGISPVEKGIVVHYGTLGKRTLFTDFYVAGSDMGRTLTHEVGHYFNLLHTWGEEDGKCPQNGGDDDGIADTPPQAYPSSGCPNFPKTDGCSKTPPGIMFMNYMDYSVDRCLLMFTHGQVQRMRGTLTPGGDTYGFTQQPWLLEYPSSTATLNDFTTYPNPTDDRLNIVFRRQPQGLQSIYITDMLGRIVAAREFDYQSLFYTFDVGSLYSGIYLVVLSFSDTKEVRKVMVR